jgi:hypothetical protein
MPADDIIDVFLRKWFELNPASKDDRLHVEVELRRQWGGTLMYVRKKLQRDKQTTLRTSQRA